MGRSGQHGHGQAAPVRRSPSPMEEALDGKLSRGRWNSEARELVDGMTGDVYRLGRGYEQNGGHPAEVERAAGFLAGSIDAIAILVSEIGGTPSNWKTIFDLDGIDGVRGQYTKQKTRLEPAVSRKRPNASARAEIRMYAGELAQRPGEFVAGYRTGLEMTVTTLGDLDCRNPMVALQL